MSGMQFLVDFAGALAWPAAIVAVVAFLRRPIIDILTQLASGLRRLRAGQSDVEFDRIVSQVKAELTATVSGDLGPPVPALLRYATLAEEEPAAAITQSCAAVEAGLRDLLTASGKLVPAGGGDPAAVARFARDQRLVPESVVQAVDGLIALRNQAAGDPARITRQHARQYLALVDAVAFVIGSPARRILSSQPPAPLA
jgi:hypothetical protein